MAVPGNYVIAVRASKDVGGTSVTITRHYLLRVRGIHRLYGPSFVALKSISGDDNFRKFRTNEHPLECGFTATPVERLEETISRS